MPTTNPRRTPELRLLGSIGLIELIVLVALTSPGTVRVGQGQQRRARGTDEFRILYWPADEEQALIAEQAAVTALRRLQQALDVKLRRRIQIEVCHTQREFNECVGERSAPWIMGRAFPDRNRVVVKALGPERIGTLVAHELCHILLHQKLDQTGTSEPRWLHEGLAKYATKDLPMQDQQILSQAAAAHKLLTFAELEEAFGGPSEKVSLAYAQSYTLVRYLAELEPGEGVGRFLYELGQVGEVDRALLRAYQKPVEQLEKEWLERVRRDYIGRGIMDQYGLIIWVAMAGLFVVAVAVRLYRARRIRRRLQEEERLRELLEGPDEV